MKKFLSIIALLLGLIPSTSLTVLAWEGNPYADLVNTTTQVTFNGKPWVIIADNSTALNDGTVTLLAADTSFGLEVFSSSMGNNNYSSSNVKSKLDSYTASGGDFENVVGTIADTDLQDVSVTGAKLYLLSKDEANALPEDVRKLFFNGATTNEGAWWLRTPGSTGFVSDAWCVRGDNGVVRTYAVVSKIGVRPALKLDLSKVTFNSTTKTFTVPSADAATNYDLTLADGTEDATNWQGKAGEGEYQALPLEGVAAGTAVSVKYSGTKKVKSVKAKKK